MQVQELPISSIASALGMRYNEATSVLKGTRLLSRNEVDRLMQLFPEVNWREIASKYEAALAAGHPQEELPISPELDDMNLVLEVENVLGVDRQYYRDKFSDDRVLAGWLRDHPAFTLEALQYTFGLDINRDNRRIAFRLYDFQYYPRQERRGMRRLRVWRWDPLRMHRKV